MSKGIGPQSGFAGGSVIGLFVSGFIMLCLGFIDAGAILIGSAVVAHAIRDIGK